MSSQDVGEQKVKLVSSDNVEIVTGKIKRTLTLLLELTFDRAQGGRTLDAHQEHD